MDLTRDIPMGFGMALMQDETAARAFYNMPPQQQQEIIARTHSISSKAEMKSLISSLLP